VRDDCCVHDELIRSARRRIWLTTAGGLALLTSTMGAIVFPVAWILGAASNPLGTGLGTGLGLVWWSTWVSLTIGLVVAIGAFAWSLLHAEARVLEFVRAWPGPRATPNPPPRLPDDALPRAEKLLTGLALAAGIHAPRVAVVIDDAPNCLTVGRTSATAWIVVTTGLLDLLPKRELEAVLAYEMGRVVELEVSLDTVVYALTARTFELWAATFANLDHMSLVFAPLAIVSLPFMVACGLLRAAALRRALLPEPGRARPRTAANPRGSARRSPRRSRQRTSLARVPAHARVALAAADASHPSATREAHRARRRAPRAARRD